MPKLTLNIIDREKIKWNLFPKYFPMHFRYLKYVFNAFEIHFHLIRFSTIETFNAFDIHFHLFRFAAIESIHD